MLSHSHLGHPSFDHMKILFPNSMNNIKFHCDTCQFAKQTHNPFLANSHIPSTSLSLIHNDVWGPSRIETHTKAKWFLSFIDNHTQLTWISLMKVKSKVCTIFKNFHTFVQTQFQTSIKILCSDNETEYLNSDLCTFLTENGIHHQTSCVYSPQQNRVARGKIDTYSKLLVLGNNVPHKFWGDSILTTAYLINCMPSKVFNFQTTFDFFLTFYPHSHLINSLLKTVFGCTAFVFHDASNKLES